MPDLTVAFPIAFLILSCNLWLLSTIAAGQAEEGSAVQVLAFIGQILMFALAVVASIVLLLALGHRGSSGPVVIVLSLLLGFAVSVVLVFMEYVIVGRRRRFRAYLSRSLWLGPLGRFRF